LLRIRLSTDRTWRTYAPDMLPGERVTAIKRIAEKLSGEPWTDLVLKLDQFGFSSSGADSDPYRFVTGHLADESDKKLSDLLEYLFPGVEPGPGADGDPRGPWSADHFRLFISHRSSEKQFAGQISSRLARWGVDAFVAHDQIEPTQEWQERIEAGLRTCDSLVAILTPDFLNSEWCDQEVGYCMARNILIVPLSLDGTNPHGFIGKYQRMNARTTEEVGGVASRLFSLLASNDRTRDKMILPIAMRYARSYSFDDARENFDRLKTISKENWTPELGEIIEDAPANNGQVREAGTNDGDAMPEAATKFVDEMLDRRPEPEDSPT
jgi:TIR domain